MRFLLLVPAAALLAGSLGGCAALGGAAVGGAAVAVYKDENDVCDPPTPAGVLDDDC